MLTTGMTRVRACVRAALWSTIQPRVYVRGGLCLVLVAVAKWRSEQRSFTITQGSFPPACVAAAVECVLGECGGSRAAVVCRPCVASYGH